jgi:RNA polymerase sigma-70 factor (ECF subfamily)
MSADPNDAELLARWRTGESLAGERLFARHFDRVERFFLNKVEPEQVGDLVQETFVACVEGRERIQQGERFRGYLLGIANHVLHGYLRRKYNLATEPLDHSIAGLSRSPSSIIAKHDEQRLLLEGLRSLSVRYQVVLELYYWEELDTNEIAEVLAIPPGTSRTWLRRARIELEAALTRLGSQRQGPASSSELDVWASECRRELFG